MVGITSLAPQIEDVLLEKVDQPICTFNLRQKLRQVTPVAHFLKHNSTVMETLIALLLAISTTHNPKADTFLQDSSENYKKWETFYSHNTQSSTTEAMVSVVFMSFKTKTPINSAVDSSQRKVKPK